jgi:hypothetical protein
MAGLLAPPASDPVGMALIYDDQVTVRLTGLEAPPEGMQYEAWLTEGGSGLFSLGAVTVNDGQFALNYTDREGRNLLANHNGFALSIEPDPDDDPAVSGDIAYAGHLTDEQTSRLRLLFDVNRDTTFAEMLINGVKQQSLVYDSHLDNTIGAIRTENLAGAKSHGEHVINILVGRESPEYLDYDGNGRAENPGDGGGLINYLQVIQESLLATAAFDESENTRLPVIAAMIDPFLLDADDAMNGELSITAADAIEEIVPIAEDLATLHLESSISAMADQLQDFDLGVGIDIFPATQ